MWSLLFYSFSKQPFHTSSYLCCLSLSPFSTQLCIFKRLYLGCIQYSRCDTLIYCDPFVCAFFDYARLGWHIHSSMLWPSISFLHRGSKSYCLCISVVVLSQMSFFEALDVENGCPLSQSNICTCAARRGNIFISLPPAQGRRFFFSQVKVTRRWRVSKG